MKLAKSIVLASLAISASFASAAECAKAAQAALTKNQAQDAALAASLTGQAARPAAQPQDSNSTIGR